MLRKNVTDYLNVKKSVTKVVDNGAVLLKNSRSEKEWSVINSRIIHHRFDLIKGIDEFENALSSMRPRRVIIVICPCSSRWTELYESRLELESFCNRIDKLPNVDVVNMFGSDDFTDADFVDPTHFNIDGARKFTIRLMSEIKL